MVKTVATEADAFAVYEAYFRANEGGTASLLELSDTGFYGSNSAGLSVADQQQEHIDLSAMLLVGEAGVGASNPLSVQAVSQIADVLLAQVDQAAALTGVSNANFTQAELDARAAQLAADMLAQFQAQIAANPETAAYLPNTPEEEAQFNSGVASAVRDLADARSYFQRLAGGETSPEVIGLTVAAAVKTATSVLGVLPLPPAAKAAVNIVNFASYLAPGIAAAVQGDGDPTTLLTIALQMATSVLTWGASDYFFDYVAPVIVSAAVNAEMGANGIIDLSPTAISQGLIEAAVHDNGGTLPDWWYSATGGSNGFDQTLARAEAIADAYGGFLNAQSFMARLSAELAWQYGSSGNYYQELTLNLDPNLGAQRYYFARNGALDYRPYFGASNIISPGVDPNTSNPWDLITVTNAPIAISGGLYVLEKDSAVFSTSNGVDTVFAPVGRPVNLLAGDDSFNFAQDALGGTGVSLYYQTVTAGLVDGGAGYDTLSTVALTEGNPIGFLGDIVIDHTSVRYVTGLSDSLDPSNLRTIATHQNFEAFHTGSLRLFDMRQSTHAVSLTTENALDHQSRAEVYGSAYGDTLYIDSSRSVTASVTLWQGQVTSVDYGDNSAQIVTVDAGGGNDYVAGELVNGASYQGGTGVDTFEILTPDVLRASEPSVIANTYFVTSLDLESGASWMRTHAVGNSIHDWIAAPHYDVLVHTDSTARVEGFEWAVGSAYQDIIYALNAGSRIRGQDGNDTLYGRGGSDQLYGGAGDDSLLGGAGVDRLQGGAGNDTLDGGGGRDVLMGGEGDDVITDFEGQNLISGNAGNDRITVGDIANEIYGGAGHDIIRAGNGGNQIFGGAGNDNLQIGSGNDTISLGTGVDALLAGAGDDVVSDIWGAGGGTVIDGGAGYDVLRLDMTGSSLVFGDIGTFQSASFSYSFVIGVSEATAATNYTNFEEIHLSGGDLTVDMVAWSDLEPDFWPSIAGHAIDNAIGTGSGNDVVALGAGNDTYFAGLGNDTIAGEGHYDTLDYSRLDSAYHVDFSGLDANGDGAIRILDASDALVATDLVSGFEAIVGTSHGEVITLDAGDNILRGGGGDDTLRGGLGNDRFVFGVNDGSDHLADAEMGDILVFEGPDGSAAPSLSRTGNAGNYTYTVSFGSTSASFTSPDLLDLESTSRSDGGTTTWEMTVVDGTLVARDDSGAGFATNEDTVLTTSDVLANDTDPGAADVVIVSYDATSAHGAVVTRVPGTGQFTYDPANIFDGLIDGQFATDSFTYTISDGTTTTTATVTINVAGFTDNPVAYPDQVTTTEDSAVVVDALANDFDPGAQDAVVSAYDSQGTDGGSVVYNGDGTFTYTPGAGFNSLGAGETGTDTFTYTLDDGRYASTTTVTVTVTGVDDPFTATDDARVVLEDQVLTLDVLANDIDPDGDPVSLVRVGTPNVGSAAIVDGQIVYTPPTNYNGPVTFTYDATDGQSIQTATVSLNYVAVDDAPTIVNDTVSATLGRGPVVIDVLANDFDPEGGALSIVGATSWSSQSGPVQVINNQVVWSPAADIGPGTYELFYGIQDDAGHITYDGRISVTLLNEQAPYAINFVETAYEDVPFTGSGTASYYDGNGDALSVVSIETENIANATVVDNGDGTYTVTPDANFVGIVYVPVVVTDGVYEVAHVQQINFNNTYDPVTLNGDVYRIGIDELLTVHTGDLLANDVNPDGAMRGYVTSVGLGTNGTVSGYGSESSSQNFTNPSHPGLMDGPSAVLNSQAGGHVNFTPGAGFHGIATFQYNFFETIPYHYAPNNGVVTVYVDTDVAALEDTATTAEETAIVVNVLANDSDADGDAMVVYGVDQPANGVAEVLGDGSIRYTPNADFNGTETLTYYVGSEFQPESAASTATLTITVTPVVDPVTAVDDSIETAEDQPVMLDLLGNDRDPDGLGGAILEIGTPGHGSIRQDGQTFTYLPDANFNGTDSFTYTREDGLGGTTTATVTATVTAVNDAPVAQADSVIVAEDGSLTFDPRSNDSDPENTALSIVSLGTPSHGSVVRHSDGTVTYVPDANFNGTDSFTYEVSDGALTSTATVTVEVQPVNDAPVALGDVATTAEDTPVTVNVTANDLELDGESLVVTGVTGAAHGQVQFSGGEITYTPDADFNGLEQLTYTVSDGQGGSATAELTVTVSPVNDAPMVVDDTSSGVQSAIQILSPLANDSDAEGNPLTLTALNGTAVLPGQMVTLSSGALVVLNGDMTVSYLPGGIFDRLQEGESTTESVSYTVSDGRGGLTSGRLQFTVNGINDAPVAAPDQVSTAEDTALTVGVLANDRDAEGTPLVLTAVAVAAHGTVSFTLQGSVTYTPDANFNGVEEITYTLSDGVNSSTGTLTVTVQPVNDTPVAVSDTATTNEDTAVIVDVLANDSDVEATPLQIIGFGQGTNGSVEIQNGQLVYTPDANFHGTDSFTYDVSDGALTSTATVTVEVQPVNDAPIAVSDTATTNEDTAVTVDVLANDSDVEATPLLITSLGGSPISVGENHVMSSGARVTLNLDGTVTFDPNGAFEALSAGGAPAVVEIPYAFVDAGGLTANGVIEVTVTGVNDSAQFSGALQVTMSEDDLGTQGAITVVDPDSPAGMLSGSYTGTYGTLAVTEAGQWVYARTAVLDDLAPGQSVVDRFTLQSVDGTQTELDITIEGALDHLEIFGTADSEVLTGGDGNDTITGLAGDDTITGGLGFDYAAYLGNSDTFTFAFAAERRGLIVTDGDTLDGLDEGTDLILAGTDAILFADGAVGEMVWQGDQLMSMELRHDGVLVSRLAETNGGRGRAVVYENGVATSVILTNTEASGGSQTWATRIQTLDESGQVARSETVFEDGTTRSVDYTFVNGVRTMSISTDGSGDQSGARWQSMVRAFNADGTVESAELTYDDGTTRSVDFTYADGARTAAILTDGDGDQSSARWQSLERTFNADGTVGSADLTYDDGTTRTIEYTYVDGVRATAMFTDGSGSQSRAPWQSLLRTFDADGRPVHEELVFDDGSTRQREYTYSDGVLSTKIVTDGTGPSNGARWSTVSYSYDAEGVITQKVTEWDDGDRTTVAFENGLRVSSTFEDLNDDQPFEVRIVSYAADGVVTDTEYVWDSVSNFWMM